MPTRDTAQAETVRSPIVTSARNANGVSRASSDRRRPPRAEVQSCKPSGQLFARAAVVDGRYRVLDRIGSGGTAVVYVAEDLVLRRSVALKVLRHCFADDDEFVARFRREASSAAAIRHQHIVFVYDRGTWDGTHYITMEYVDGRSLRSIIREHAPLGHGHAIDLIVQLLRAAAYMHRNGLVHRDVKPENAIVDGDDNLKVTDFGIARTRDSDVTRTGSIIGSVSYLSPEQAQGFAATARSDLYSVGLILYELLTGRLPFADETALAVALKHISERPAPPSTLNPTIPPELDVIVMRALEKDPARRFADADEFIDALGHTRISSRAATQPVRAKAVGVTCPNNALARMSRWRLLNHTNNRQRQRQ